MSQPNYITCPCQNCNGHIKFDANELKSGETRRIECPHCHLETVLFNKPNDTSAHHPFESGKMIPIKKSQSSKIELFLFELTRMPMIAGAVLVLLAFIIAAALAAKALLPEKPPKPPVISYEMVAPVQKITPDTPNNEGAFIPQGAKMAKQTFPQPVVDFLLEHQGFSLKEWLNQLNPEQRKAFLDNLATILVTANSKHLTKDKIEPMVTDFADLWTTAVKDEAADRGKKAAEKQARFSLLISMVSGLFITLMTLSLVLVLLAIERNTRSNGNPKEAK